MKPMSKSPSYRMRPHSRLRRLILPLLLASCATMAGCATRPVVTPNPCAGWVAIYPSKADVLTDGTAKQILAHDRHGVDVKCWAAPGAKPHG